LPSDRAGGRNETFRGGNQGIAIGEEVSVRLRQIGREEGSTLFMVLLASFKVLLMRYTGEEDIAIGIPIANRNRKETEGLIGFFVNSLVIRSDLRRADIQGGDKTE
jgi:non-ribosomal peptide synthetase component F